jgi:ribonucleoside-diphosphate reductase beta chain
MKAKTILTTGGPSDYALHPMRYPFAWTSYKTMLANHWTPEEIGAGNDIEQWRTNQLTRAEQHLYETVFAQLTTFDLLRTTDLVQNLLPIVQAPELVHALTTQAFQECLHTHAYQYLIEAIGLPQDDLYQRYRHVAQLQVRCDMAEQLGDLPTPGALAMLNDDARFMPDATPELDNAHRDVLVTLIFYYCFFEGVWFLLNLLGPIQALSRRGLMRNTAEQFQYIARDEQSHVAFGLELIRALIAEHPHAWDQATQDRVHRLAQDALALEEQFIDYALPEPILGYNAADHSATARHYAERWLGRIGLTVDLGGEHRLPWIDEMVSHRKEKNFFESRVTEYQLGTLHWDDNEHDDDAPFGVHDDLR